MPRYVQVEGLGELGRDYYQLGLMPRHGQVEGGSGGETTVSLVSCPDMGR